MALPLRHARLFVAIGWVLVILAIFASLAPAKALVPTGVNDKIEHTAAYTLLTLWFAGLYPRSRYAVIAIGLFLMGALIEWAQGAMQLGRVADYRDVIANSVGIGAGLILALIGLGRWAQTIEQLRRRA